jgi:hypothetical protein
MCKAFSCLVDIDAKRVTWKLGVDSHSDLVALGGYKDDTADPRQMLFAKIEITPKNGDYLHPDEWVYRVDESSAPMWIGREHEAACRKAHTRWLRQLDKFIIRHPMIDPFKLKASEVGPKQIALLKKWASVRDSVGASVWAYTGSFFTIPVWKYIKHPKGKYPYQPLVALWNQGFVPSFDGTTWRLHAGPKAKIVYSIKAEELKTEKV